jgi:hypothetical protein
MDDYIRNIVDDDFPNGIIFDEAWAWTLPEAGPDGETRLWFHPETLGDFHIHNFDPEGSGIAQAHAAGQKYVLHITPYIGIRSKYAKELLDKGCLVMRASDPSMPLVGQYHHYYLDFTNPDAVEWWKNGVRRLLALGADGFFNDFGESDDQRDALYMKGTGASFGQKYCILNRKALWEVLQEVKDDHPRRMGRDASVWRRPYRRSGGRLRRDAGRALCDAESVVERAGDLCAQPWGLRRCPGKHSLPPMGSAWSLQSDVHHVEQRTIRRTVGFRS